MKKKKRFRKLTKLDSSGDAKLSNSTLTLTVNVSAMGKIKSLALTQVFHVKECLHIKTEISSDTVAYCWEQLVSLHSQPVD